MTDNVYYKQKLLDDTEISEIDIDFQDLLGFEWEKHDDYVNILPEEYGRAEGFPIDIDRMISKLEEMKKAGATHVGIEYHTDHIGYLIDAWKIEKASEKEVKLWKHKKEKDRKERIEATKQELQRKLEKLEKLS